MTSMASGPAHDDPPEHPLTGKRISAAITVLAFSGIGLTLMGIALDARKFLFWLGLAIAWIAAPLTVWLFWKELKSRSLVGLVVACAVVAELAVPCALFFVPTPTSVAAADTDPRDKLGRMGVPYSFEGFESALNDGRLDVLRTFFDAGFSANRIASTDMFSSTFAMKGNDNNFEETLALMKARGLDYHAINHSNGIMQHWPLGRALDQEEELFYVASISNRSDTDIKALLREGADPTSLLNALKQRMVQSPSPYLTEIAVPLRSALVGTRYSNL